MNASQHIRCSHYLHLVRLKWRNLASRLTISFVHSSSSKVAYWRFFIVVSSLGHLLWKVLGLKEVNFIRVSPLTSYMLQNLKNTNCNLSKLYMHLFQCNCLVLYYHKILFIINTVLTYFCPQKLELIFYSSTKNESFSVWKVTYIERSL